MDKNYLPPNVVLRGLIDDCDVMCFSVIEGAVVDGADGDHCGWIGKLKDAETHYAKCPHGLVVCPFDGCDTICTRRDLQNHQLVCVYRQVYCRWCDAAIIHNAAEAHETSCAFRLVPCPNACQAAGDRRNVEDSEV